MFKKPEEVIEFIKKEKVVQVDLKLTSLSGRWHHLTIPATSCTPELFKKGEAFDGSSIGYRKVESGDMVIIPDPKTALIDPFCEIKTLSMTCDIVEADTKEPFVDDPRGVARKVEEYLAETGIADQVLCSPEYEFYVFDSVRYENDININSYIIDSAEAAWNTYLGTQQNLGHKIPHHGGYHATPPMDTMFNFRSRVVDFLIKNNIDVRYHHHEVGGPGQGEIEVGFSSVLGASDNGMLIKYAVKNFASQIGKTATFMPKPLYNEAGSGMHVHMMLRKNGKPIFYDKKGYANLSETALHFIAGILHHSPSLVAFTNPSTNSFKRLVPGFEAPVKLFFSLANRTAAIRVPKYAVTPDEKRFEYRPMDGTCNLYLALSAIVMAGIDGVKKKLNPVKEHFGPFDEDIQKMDTTKRDKIKSLPESVYIALSSLEKDHDYLLAGGVFNESLIKTWIAGRTKEADRVRNTPHPYEIRLYYDV